MTSLLRSNAPRHAAARLVIVAALGAAASGSAVALADGDSGAHAIDPLPAPVSRAESEVCLRQLGLATRPAGGRALDVRFSDVRVRFTFHPDQRRAHEANAAHMQRFADPVPPLPAVVNNVSYRASGPLAYTHLLAAESCLRAPAVVGA